MNLKDGLVLRNLRPSALVHVATVHRARRLTPIRLNVRTTLALARIIGLNCRYATLVQVVDRYGSEWIQLGADRPGTAIHDRLCQLERVCQLPHLPE